MMKFSMMIQIRLTILIAGQYWIPFHQRKLRKMGNVNPMKKFSMMKTGQHWIPFHQRKLRQMGNVNPMKTFSLIIAGQDWIPFQQRKRDLLGGSIYLKKDLRHPELLSVFLQYLPMTRGTQRICSSQYLFNRENFAGWKLRFWLFSWEVKS